MLGATSLIPMPLYKLCVLSIGVLMPCRCTWQGLFQDLLKKGRTHCGKFQERANPNPKGGGGNPILNIGKANCQGGGGKSIPMGGAKAPPRPLLK